MIKLPINFMNHLMPRRKLPKQLLLKSHSCYIKSINSQTNEYPNNDGPRVQIYKHISNEPGTVILDV